MASDELTKNNETAPGALTRRTASAATAAALFVPRHVLGRGHQAPSDTLAIAAIGIGGMGRNYLEGCKGEKIVALCDLDYTYAAPIFAKYPGATRYHDWREMIDKEARNFDALIVATPDHTHAVIQMAALKLKKHIYAAKPLVHSIAEARAVRKAVIASDRITQTSVQSCASERSCGTTEILNSGVLGGIRELHIWTPHPIYPCSMLRPTDTPPAPEGMDWDLWVGPAQYRPYNPVYHPGKWRAWWNFGSGTVADMACHTFHVYFNALRLGERSPKTVYGYRSYIREGFKSLSLVPTPDCESAANMVTWELPAIGNLPALNMHWYDGGMRPHRPTDLDKSIPMPAGGLLFIGDKGKMLTGYEGGNEILLPRDKFRDFQRPPKTLPRSIGHYQEWTQGCKTGKPTNCPMEFGSRMTELALLGTMAIRKIPTKVGNGWDAVVLEWDAEAMRITNDAEANEWVNPQYRAGWSV